MPISCLINSFTLVDSFYFVFQLGIPIPCLISNFTLLVDIFVTFASFALFCDHSFTQFNPLSFFFCWLLYLSREHDSIQSFCFASSLNSFDPFRLTSFLKYFFRTTQNYLTKVSFHDSYLMDFQPFRSVSLALFLSLAFFTHKIFDRFACLQTLFFTFCWASIGTFLCDSLFTLLTVQGLIT